MDFFWQVQFEFIIWSWGCVWVMIDSCALVVTESVRCMGGILILLHTLIRMMSPAEDGCTFIQGIWATFFFNSGRWMATSTGCVTLGWWEMVKSHRPNFWLFSKGWSMTEWVTAEWRWICWLANTWRLANNLSNSLSTCHLTWTTLDSEGLYFKQYISTNKC